MPRVASYTLYDFAVKPCFKLKSYLRQEGTNLVPVTLSWLEGEVTIDILMFIVKIRKRRHRDKAACPR